jgi:hypothetical protein
MVSSEFTHPQAIFSHYLATLARVRAQCERIASATPMPGDALEWTGYARDMFTENMMVLRRRAGDALMWVEEAEEAARKAMMGPHSG